MSRNIIKQTSFLLKQKESLLTMSILFLLVTVNYLGNIFEFCGMDISQMYQPMKLLTLSYNRVNFNANHTLLFTMLYPFLVVLPAGFSYIKERQTKEEIFLIARMGKNRYLCGKLLGAFFTTSIVFTIPFMAEIAANALSFPMSAQGDLSNFSIYSSEYANMVHNYLGYPFFLSSPVLYVVLGTVFFGMMSGLFAMFVVSLSFAISVRYRAVLLLPVFLMLNCTIYFDKIREGFTTSWYEYLLFFSDTEKNIGYLIIAILIVLLLTGTCCCIGKWKETY